MGERIAIETAEYHIFGMVLLNDWSARDIQTWEYVPLKPFLAKNFASPISCWVVTMDALEPFRCERTKQDNPKPFPYLQQEGNHAFDINLQVSITPENGAENLVSNSNLKYIYWTISQQFSMLELTWTGQNSIEMNDGSKRTFIYDNDTVIMRGYCQNENVRIGFGEVSSKLLPSISFEKYFFL